MNGEEAGIGSAQDDEEEGLDTKKVKVEQDEGEEGQVEEGVLGGYGGDLESRNRSHAVD